MNRQFYGTKRHVVFVRSRGRLTIPAAVRKRYGLEEGTSLVLAEEDDRLVLYASQEEYVEAVLGRIGDALTERGLTLKEVLGQEEEIRTELLRQRYSELVDDRET